MGAILGALETLSPMAVFAIKDEKRMNSVNINPR
jgi:hypothetical protein